MLQTRQSQQLAPKDTRRAPDVTLSASDADVTPTPQSATDETQKVNFQLTPLSELVLSCGAASYTSSFCEFQSFLEKPCSLLGFSLSAKAFEEAWIITLKTVTGQQSLCPWE